MRQIAVVGHIVSTFSCGRCAIVIFMRVIARKAVVPSAGKAVLHSFKPQRTQLLCVVQDVVTS